MALGTAPSVGRTSLKDLSPEQRLEHDKGHVGRVREHLEHRVSGVRNRLLVMLSAARGSMPLLRPTIERLIDQCRSASLQPYIMLGLDVGMEIDDERFGAEVRELHLEKKTRYDDNAITREGPSDVQCVLEQWMQTDAHASILTVSQHPDAEPGKLNMLRDMSSILLRRGHDLPTQTLLMDAESRFIESAPSNHAPSLETDGLTPWKNTLDHSPEQSVIGMRMRTVSYSHAPDGTAHPDFHQPLTEHHYRLNRAMEINGYPDMAGGGMGGRTLDVLPLIATIAQYRGIRAEDTAMVHLARHMEWTLHTEQQSTVLNRAPSYWQLRAAMKQIARWNASTVALEELYGMPLIDMHETSYEQRKERTINMFKRPISSAHLAFERFVMSIDGVPRDCIFEGEAHWSH